MSMGDLSLSVTGYRLRARADAAAVGLMLFGPGEGATPSGGPQPKKARATAEDLARIEAMYAVPPGAPTGAHA